MKTLRGNLIIPSLKFFQTIYITSNNEIKVRTLSISQKTF